MRVHHLNGGTLRPPCARIINGTGNIFSRGRLVCHCLLIEASDSLMLIDTGLGLRYRENPKLLGSGFGFILKLSQDPADTVAGQIEQLGFDTKDVHQIIMTHLDVDHAGGLREFPKACVHVLSEEYEAAMNPPTSFERRRYVADQWAYGPRWTIHSLQGEAWKGFENVQEILPGILLVPIIGHSRGHCGVAVYVEGQWVLHCGDAYTDRTQIDHSYGRCPLGPKMHRLSTVIDKGSDLKGKERLRDLVADNSDEITLFCSHDPREFKQLTNP